MKNKSYLFFFFVLVFLFFSFTTAYAASVSFTGNKSVTENQTFTATVNINTSGQYINTATGLISFPKDLLNVQSINSTGSIFSIWAEQPSFSNTGGIIFFTGGVPTPGFNGSNGKILNIIFKAKSAGLATLSFSNISVLANDGKGTNVFSGNLPIYTINIEKAVIKPEPKVKVKKPSPIIEKIIEMPKEAFEMVREIEEEKQLPKYSLVTILSLALILLLVLILIYVIYYIKKLKNYLKKKLTSAKKDVIKKFEILEEDVDKEITKKETASLINLKKDIENTEEVILKDIKDIEDDV